MAEKWQRVKIQLPKKFEFTPREKAQIAKDIIELIKERSEDGEGVRASGSKIAKYKLPKYSEGYIKSLDFKNAGKNKGSIDLTLSGDMLASIERLRESEGKNSIVVGFEKGSEENGKADGNIRGTYGTSTPNPKKKRNFLGITGNELKEILSKYREGVSALDGAITPNDN